MSQQGLISLNKAFEVAYNAHRLECWRIQLGGDCTYLPGPVSTTLVRCKQDQITALWSMHYIINALRHNVIIPADAALEKKKTVVKEAAARSARLSLWKCLSLNRPILDCSCNSRTYIVSVTSQAAKDWHKQLQVLQHGTIVYSVCFERTTDKRGTCYLPCACASTGEDQSINHCSWYCSSLLIILVTAHHQKCTDNVMFIALLWWASAGCNAHVRALQS